MLLYKAQINDSQSDRIAISQGRWKDRGGGLREKGAAEEGIGTTSAKKKIKEGKRCGLGRKEPGRDVYDCPSYVSGVI